MMPAVMCEAGLIDDLLPGGINGLRRGAGLDRPNHFIEGLTYDDGDLGSLIADIADMDEAAQRRVIPRDAARELEEDRLAFLVASITPGRMFLTEPVARTDEGTETR